MEKLQFDVNMPIMLYW